MPTTVKNATNLPMVFYKNGHDVGQCVVDDSSKLRVGLTKKFPKARFFFVQLSVFIILIILFFNSKSKTSFFK